MNYFSFVIIEKSQVAGSYISNEINDFALHNLLTCIPFQFYAANFKYGLRKTGAVNAKGCFSAP